MFNKLKNILKKVIVTSIISFLLLQISSPLIYASIEENEIIETNQDVIVTDENSTVESVENVEIFDTNEEIIEETQEDEITIQEENIEETQDIQENSNQMMLKTIPNRTLAATNNEVAVGTAAKVTALEIISTVTGTSSFDAITTTDSQNTDGTVTWTAGNDTSDSDRVVRSYDRVTYNLLVTYGIKDAYSSITNLSGGRICFECTIPENQLDNAYWAKSDPDWTTSISASAINGKKYRKITGYIDLTTSTTTIPGQKSLSFDLMTLRSKEWFRDTAYF